MKLLKNTCEEIHSLAKLQTVSPQASNFTENEFHHKHFLRILVRFYVIIYCILEFQEHYSKHLLMAASVSTCNNSHLYIQPPRKMFDILTVHSYSFLPFLYNLSHTLTELNVSLFFLINSFPSKMFIENNHMLMYKILNLILFNRFVYIIS